MDLLKTLETSLINLLEPVRQDPWSLLMYQTLLWSFRRWAIHYLTSSDTPGAMIEYVWDSHLELVREFAPNGLKDFAVIWLNPSNVGDRVDGLEELNQYFMLIIEKLDLSLVNDNEDEQDALSVLLDDTFAEVIDRWLNGKEDYRIYPKLEQSIDEFSPERVFQMMQLILKRNVVEPEQQAEPEPEPPQESQQEPPQESQQEQQQESQPEPQQEQQAEPQQEQQQEQQPEPQPPPEPAQTVREALKNRTRRIHRKEQLVKTRKRKA